MWRCVCVGRCAGEGVVLCVCVGCVWDVCGEAYGYGIMGVCVHWKPSGIETKAVV